MTVTDWVTVAVTVVGSVVVEVCVIVRVTDFVTVEVMALLLAKVSVDVIVTVLWVTAVVVSI